MQDNGIYLWLAIIGIVFASIAAVTTCASGPDSRRQICLARNGTLLEENGHYLEPYLVRCRNDSGIFYIHTRTGLKLVPVLE